MLHPKDNMQVTTDESDETLSLCDLPLYSDHRSVEEWQEDFSSQSQGSSSTSSKQDYSEFSSQELGPSTTGFPPESIVFCGKLIPYKEQEDEDSSQLVESKKVANTMEKSGWGMMRWIFCASGKNQKSITIVHKDQSAKKKYNGKKHGKGYEYPVHKMPLLTSSTSGKARWYLFGISRFSREVQLKDIKSRLSSHSHSPSPPPSPVTLSSGSRLTGLIRVLSCGGNHPNTMVVASTSFSRQECGVFSTISD